MFAYIIIAGGATMTISVLFQESLEPPTCDASYWLQVLGLTTLYSSLLLKNYRILTIFSRKSLVVESISNLRLIGGVFALLLIDVALLLVFTANSSCGEPENSAVSHGDVPVFH